MTTAHQAYFFQSDPLDIKQLAEFDAVLGEISDEEKRRKRVLYLGSAAEDNQRKASSLKYIKYVMIPILVFPLLALSLPFSQSVMRLELPNILIFLTAITAFTLTAWFGMRRIDRSVKRGVDRMIHRLNIALQYWGISQEEVAGAGFHFDWLDESNRLC